MINLWLCWKKLKECVTKTELNKIFRYEKKGYADSERP